MLTSGFFCACLSRALFIFYLKYCISILYIKYCIIKLVDLLLRFTFTIVIMRGLETYITDIIGAVTNVEPVQPKEMGRVPVYLSESYSLYRAKVFGVELMLVQQKPGNELTTGQIMKNLAVIKGLFGQVVVLVTDEMSGIRRRRLINDRFNFIVPGKQMFLPELMVDLRERGATPKQSHVKETLLPSAQFILLYHILRSHHHGMVCPAVPLHTRWKTAVESEFYRGAVDKFFVFPWQICIEVPVGG